MFAAEARGELKSGTARRWAEHTKSFKDLPERVKKSARYTVKRVPVRESRWEGAIRGTGGSASTAGLLGGTAVGALRAARDLKRGNFGAAAKTVASTSGVGWLGGSIVGAAHGAAKPKTRLKYRFQKVPTGRSKTARKKREKLDYKEYRPAGFLGGTMLGTAGGALTGTQLASRMRMAHPLVRGAVAGGATLIGGMGGAVGGVTIGSALTKRSRKKARERKEREKSAEGIAIEAGARHAIKIAFGTKAMQRVLRVVKSKQLPKAAIKGLVPPGLVAPISVLRNALPIGALQTGKKGLKASKWQTASRVKDMRHMRVPENVIKDTETYDKGLQKGLVSRLPAGGVILQSQGIKKTLGQTMKRIGRKLPKLDPKESKALEAVTKGHELAEIQVKASPAFLHAGHQSPDVILREHNMIQTLPKKYKKVSDVFRSMRSGQEADAIHQATGGKFEYGKGQRLSRHGRKNVTRLIEDLSKKERLKAGLPE